MSLWRQLSHGVRSLVNRSATDRDIADEVEQYLDDAAAAFEASGLSPEEARRAARRQLGSVTAVREQVRAYGWENVVDPGLRAEEILRLDWSDIERHPDFIEVAAHKAKTATRRIVPMHRWPTVEPRSRSICHEPIRHDHLPLVSGGRRGRQRRR